MKLAPSSAGRRAAQPIVRKTWVISSTVILLRDTDTTAELSGRLEEKIKRPRSLAAMGTKSCVWCRLLFGWRRRAGLGCCGSSGLRSRPAHRLRPGRTRGPCRGRYARFSVVSIHDGLGNIQCAAIPQYRPIRPLIAGGSVDNQAKPVVLGVVHDHGRHLL